MSLLRSAAQNVRSALGLYALVTGAMTLVALVIAVLLFIFLPELQTTARLLVALSLVLFLLFLIGAYSEVKTTLLARQTRYGTNIGIMSAAFLGIAVMVNVLSAQNHQRIDLTEGGQYTLARQTVAVLKDLKDDVKVTGFFQKDPTSQAAQQQAQSLLTEYRFQSNRISFEFIDPDDRPGVARQFEVRDFPALVFEVSGRRKQITGVQFQEQDFTGAILNVTGTQQPRVYFVIGHGEKDIGGGDGSAYQLVREGLTSDNYEVRTLNLNTDPRVPDDAALVVLAGPQKPLLAPEVKALDDYLQNGGKGLFLLDPNAGQEIKDLLSKWGVVVRDGIVVDQGVFVNPDVTVPAAQGPQYTFQAITRDLAASFFPEATGLDVNVPEDDRDHVAVTPLALTSPRSFLKVGTDSRTQFDPNVDQRGPLPLALVVDANKPIGQRPPRVSTGPDAPPAPDVKNTRLVVFADSDFPSNDFYSSLGNADLFLNSVNWLTEHEELISIRPKADPFRRLVITQQQWNLILYSTIAFWPLAILVAGGVAWWRRR